jgi:hypothetical protein
LRPFTTNRTDRDKSPFPEEVKIMMADHLISKVKFPPQVLDPHKHESESSNSCPTRREALIGCAECRKEPDIWADE